MTYELFTGDCRDAMRAMAPGSIDAIVCDPPYGLGFMGKEWDHGVPGVEFWTEALRVAKPGAHLVAFGGTRTYHRLAVAIEDAGWEVRDCLSWLYGSGFPKSLDISKAMDKGSGVNRERQLEFTAWMRSTGITAAQINDATSSAMASHYLTDKEQPAIATADMFDLLRPHLPVVPEHIERLVAERTGIEWTDYIKRPILGTARGKDAVAGDLYAPGGGVYLEKEYDITAPATDLAKQWDGWGTALKPAWEPIILARKPLIGTVAANVTAHGTGGLNISGCRIALEEKPKNGVRAPGMRESRSEIGPPGGYRADYDPAGRWPANVCLDEEAARLLDGQRERDLGGYGDTGGASRFFYCAKASRSERWEYLYCDCETPIFPVWVNADQNRSDRTASTSPARAISEGSSTDGCNSPTSPSGSASTDEFLRDFKSTTSTKTSRTTASKTCDSSVPQSTSESTPDVSSEATDGGNPAGSAENSSLSTPTIGISPPKGGRSMGVAVPATSPRSSETSNCGSCGKPLQRVGHPTVKPLALMRWLCRLVTPPGGLILDPFAGSGTTGCAAVLEGFRFTGAELDPAHVAIAERRIAYWAAEAVKEREARELAAREAPLDLFDPAPGELTPDSCTQRRAENGR